MNLLNIAILFSLVSAEAGWKCHPGGVTYTCCNGDGKGDKCCHWGYSGCNPHVANKECWCSTSYQYTIPNSYEQQTNGFGGHTGN